MRRYNSVDRRALAAGTALIALGTLVRTLLAPAPAELGWKPAGTARPAETLSEARVQLDSALSIEAEASRPLADGERIDVNTATGADLRRIRGIGRSRAAAILEDRVSNGPFRSPRDLLRVPGVGEGLLRSITPYIITNYDSDTGAPDRSERRIDLNRAQIKDLEQITGIGPTIAARIVSARAERGPFRTMDDLLAIPGIGPKTLQFLRKQAYVR